MYFLPKKKGYAHKTDTEKGKGVVGKCGHS